MNDKLSTTDHDDRDDELQLPDTQVMIESIRGDIQLWLREKSSQVSEDSNEQ